MQKWEREKNALLEEAVTMGGQRFLCFFRKIKGIKEKHTRGLQDAAYRNKRGKGAR